MSRYQAMIVLLYSLTLFHTIFLVEERGSQISPWFKKKKKSANKYHEGKHAAGK